MIARFASPFSVRMPFLSNALAIGPKCLVGSCSSPSSLKERCSQYSGSPIRSFTTLMVSVKSFLHFLELPFSFQSFTSTALLLNPRPDLLRILLPSLSRIYSFLCLAPHFPFSSTGRRVSIRWKCRLWMPFWLTESWIAQSAHIPLETKFRCT